MSKFLKELAFSNSKSYFIYFNTLIYKGISIGGTKKLNCYFWHHELQN